LLWLAAAWVQGRWQQAGDPIEPLAAGWLLVTLAALAWWSGMTFLVGGALGGGVAGDLAREVAGQPGRSSLAAGAMPAASAVLAALAVAWVARAWPVLRQLAWLVVALVAVGGAWLLPTLGGVLLALAVTTTQHRWRLASAAAVALAWIVGSFYYQLAWPLAEKALMLVAAGAVLGALAWWQMRPQAVTVRSESASLRLDRATVWLAFGTLVALFVAGAAIWQKQDVIARGQPVFVELAPADPRSLMQGDYMALNFRLPDGAWKIAPPGVAGERPHVVATRNERGVARLLRLRNPGVALAADEFVIELSPKNGGWVLVTDAWFFREGDDARWATARYGEFRVAGDGKALLVGMADADLKPIHP